MFIEVNVFYWKAVKAKVEIKPITINTDGIRYFSPGVNCTIAESSKQEIHNIRDEEKLSYIVMSEGSGWTVDMPYTELKKLIVPQVITSVPDEDTSIKNINLNMSSVNRFRMCGDYDWAYCDGDCNHCSRYTTKIYMSNHT